MSPEQALSKKIDHRSDLYSLGVIFYEMLVGERPYAGDDAPQVVHKHIHSPIPRLPEHLAQYQPLLEKLMGKLPEHRFRTAEIALENIRAYLAALAPQAHADVTAPVAGLGARDSA
jgi:serine/threonine-protein kinase PpkA